MQVRMSKSSANLESFPRLFAGSEIPGLECHQVWLYITWYGYNYNVNKNESEDESGSCRDESEFAMITESIESPPHSQWSFETTTDQILTPLRKQSSTKPLLDIDDYAITPRLQELPGSPESLGVGNKTSPTLIGIEEQNDEENDTFLLRKAGSAFGS
ncbi:hypothetical protein TWF694_001009 [Orbilia ellipsospora]|uniref:Uncharacterized protein n=1 Tax=Orbilia ellipsospora TaxID=2528407 RepID=A0AAV9XQS4_9PEZI